MLENTSMKHGHGIMILMLIIPTTSSKIKESLNQPTFVFRRFETNQTKTTTANETAAVVNVTTNVTDWGVTEPPQRAWSITQPGYDIRLPPRDAATRRPVQVLLMAYTDFIETVNEQDGEMVVALFFKASWKDSRVRELLYILRDRPGYRQDMLPMSGRLKERLWVPDLYLPMARRVAIPTIHEPAESVTLQSGGVVQYSAFFVIALKCQMTYRDYPMDVQVCYMDVMSYKYSTDEMQLQWHTDSLQGQKSITTRHFYVAMTLPKVNNSFVLENPDGSMRYVVRLKIQLRRHLTFHLLQTYLPSVMLVFIGWLSLLVPLDFAYGRMVLSVTTLLVLVSIFVTNSHMAPGVNEVRLSSGETPWRHFSCHSNKLMALRHQPPPSHLSRSAGGDGSYTNNFFTLPVPQLHPVNTYFKR